MNYSDIAKSIANTIKKGSTPLTVDQKTVLAGAISVWLEKCSEQNQVERQGYVALNINNVRDVILWMVEKINTTYLDVDDKYRINAIADDCFLAITNKRYKKKAT